MNTYIKIEEQSPPMNELLLVKFRNGHREIVQIRSIRGAKPVVKTNNGFRKTEDISEWMFLPE